jgi:predicted transposase YdaD
MPSSPHDALFKASFGQPDIARSELELVLPDDVRAHLELATLEVLPGSFVDEALQHTHTDLLYAVQTKDGPEALVYVVFEHLCGAPHKCSYAERSVMRGPARAVMAGPAAWGRIGTA